MPNAFSTAVAAAATPCLHNKELAREVDIEKYKSARPSWGCEVLTEKVTARDTCTLLGRGFKLPRLYTLPIYDYDLRATHARTLLPAALASVSFGFVLVRVRVRLCLVTGIKVSTVHEYR
jgi:hypothetical protein